MQEETRAIDPTSATLEAASLEPPLDGSLRLFRVLTYGKGQEAVEREVVAAVGEGRQVLVSAAGPTGGISDGGQKAVTDWAETLSREQGLAWQRVGRDILFTRRPS